MDDLVSPLRAVSVLDPAIDLSVTPVEVYAVSRAPDLVTLLPGMVAKWATLRPLSVGDFVAVESMPTSSMRGMQAFRLACSGVENLPASGTGLYPTKPHRLPNGTERMVWGDEELQRLSDALGMRWIIELGQVAYERADQGNALSGGGSFTLPLSSLHELRRIVHLHAARTAASDGTASSAT